MNSVFLLLFGSFFNTSTVVSPSSFWFCPVSISYKVLGHVPVVTFCAVSKVYSISEFPTGDVNRVSSKNPSNLSFRDKDSSLSLVSVRHLIPHVPSILSSFFYLNLLKYLQTETFLLLSTLVLILLCVRTFRRPYPHTVTTP